MAQSIRVLHVDTEPNNGDLTATTLDREVDDIAVETATSAAEGLNTITNDSPDCVVFACHMPGQNNTGFLELVRDEYPELPLILLTTDADAEVVSEAISAGATDYFQITSELEQYQLLGNRIKNVVQSRQSTKQLTRKNELMRLTEVTANVGSWELDLETDELDVTPGAGRLTGLSSDDNLSPDGTIDLYHPDDQPEVRAALDRAAETGEQVQGTWRIQPPDGCQRTADVTITPVSSNGEVTSLRGTIHDVTERRERREELEQVETLFQHTQGPLFLIDVEDGAFRIKRVNWAWEDATGVSPDSAHGQTIYELLGEKQGNKVAQRYHECVERREPIEYEEQLQFGDDRIYWETRIAPVVIEGDVEYIAGSTRNITESRERQRELRLLQQAIDDAEMPVTLADPSQEDNPLVYANNAYQELTGYSQQEALGRNCRYLQGENTDPGKVRRLREAINDEEPATVKLRNYRKDGTEFWNRVTVTPIYDDSGTLIRYLGSQRDITERRDRKKYLQLLDRVLRHNLRNDMSVIRGRAETIAAEASGTVATDATQIVETSNGLVELAEKERKLADTLRREPTKKQLDLRVILERACSEARSEHPEATITLECPTEVTVRTTADLGQAVGELTSNAIVHNDSESSEVSISAARTQAGSRIEVADNGPRIPKMERDILTDGINEEPLYHGRGLGLWLVRLIITQAGGSISVKQRSQTGKSIRIELP